MNLNGKLTFKILKNKAKKHGVKMIDAFLLAGLHPSNATLWSQGKTRPRLYNAENVEVAIELLGELSPYNSKMIRRLVG